jgi:hypothetical protein
MKVCTIFMISSAFSGSALGVAAPAGAVELGVAGADVETAAVLDAADVEGAAVLDDEDDPSSLQLVAITVNAATEQIEKRNRCVCTTMTESVAGRCAALCRSAGRRRRRMR